MLLQLRYDKILRMISLLSGFDSIEIISRIELVTGITSISKIQQALK
ncbi:MAG: hypothetical protein WCL43_00245 [Chlorobium sp.]